MIKNKPKQWIAQDKKKDEFAKLSLLLATINTRTTSIFGMLFSVQFFLLCFTLHICKQKKFFQ